MRPRSDTGTCQRRMATRYSWPRPARPVHSRLRGVEGGEPDPEETAAAEALAAETARLAASLAFAIAQHRAAGRFALAAAPVAGRLPARERRPARPLHRSGRMAPELLPFLVDAVLRTRERLALPDDEDNPYLIALVLAAFYVVDAPRTGLLGPAPPPARTPAVAAVGEVEALLDLAGRRAPSRCG